MEITLVTFSPTHTGLTVGTAVARGFVDPAAEGVKCVDLTLSDSVGTDIVVGDAAVFVVPVYGGRVAETAVERLKSVRAAVPGRTPAILAVVYGNRDYEDALIELHDIAVRQGFVPLSAGAFVGEHSYSRPEEGMPIAEGRPDAGDCAVAARFGADSRAKFDGNVWPPLAVKGNRPYKVKGPSTPATPVTLSDDCTMCGLCAEVCPVGAVAFSADGIAVSEAEGCVKCCACVRFCPAEARRFDTPYTERLFTNFSARREPELFL